MLDKKNKKSKGDIYVPMMEFQTPKNNDIIPPPDKVPPKAP